MNCPACGVPNSRVIDSRCPTGKVVYRRRECVSCFGRWTTEERMRRGSLTPPGKPREAGVSGLGSLSPRQRFAILRRDNFTCTYCGRKAPDVILHVDHRVPRALGGTNAPENLCASCADCNGGKGATPL